MKLPDLQNIIIKINFVTVIRLFKKYILHKANKCKTVTTMCFKKIINWFQNNAPVEEGTVGIAGSNKILLTFAINDYPGTNSDLRGCLNDQKNIIGKLTGYFVKWFANSKVTGAKMIAEIDKAISEAKAGDTIVIHYSGHGTQVADYNSDEADGIDEALYLYDGVLTDDRLNEALSKTPEGVTVCVLLDSCFSGSATRSVGTRNKSVVIDQGLRKRVRRFMKSAASRWIVISGCSEDQTSADAMINGEYNGAFTFYAMHCLRPGMTYKQWFEEIRKYLPNKNFDQIPTLEGPEELINKTIL